MPDSINHILYINSSKEKVYAALTTIDGLSNWWTTQTKGNTNAGGIIMFQFGDEGCDMKVISCKPNESVKWECVYGFPDWIGTRISFELDFYKGRTKVYFEHSNWREAEKFFARYSFSWERFLESLRQLCQTGKGEPFGSERYKI